VLWSACSGTRTAEPGPRVADPKSAAAAPESSAFVDDFERVEAWQAEASDDVVARREQVPGHDGQALGLTFDFVGHGGFAALRREQPLTLPEHYEISFDVRGEAPVNDLQLKFTDASGDNVWWFRQNDLRFTDDWRHVVVKKRQVEFAWGPTQQRELSRAASVTFVIAAGREGGRGSIAIDNFRLVALPPPEPPPAPVASASSSVGPEGAPALLLDGRQETAWRSAPGAGPIQALTVDYGALREFGALTLRWLPNAQASDYDVELSTDGASWQLVRQVRGGDGGHDALRLTESEARFVRLRLQRGPGPSYALAELALEDIAFGASDNAFVSALAKLAPRGHYPRAFRGEQPYWTIVGADGSPASGLLSEDGAVEVGQGGFSLEPFVIVDSQVTSWADVGIEHALAERSLPLPSATWTHPAYQLEVGAFVALEPSASKPSSARASAGALAPAPAPAAPEVELWTRYVLKNTRPTPLALKFVVAVRPYQVNPLTQFLNIAGGVSPIHDLRWDGAGLLVNDQRRVTPLRAPDHVGLSSFDSGGFPAGEAPAAGRAPQQVHDDGGLATGALVYDLKLLPGESVTLGFLAPLAAERPTATAHATLTILLARREQTLAYFRERLGRVSIRVPESGRRVVDSLRSALAHILVSRAGPVLRPGTRSYARSWIRDGAMMSESLLRLGHEQEARDYLEWFAPYQFENGKVPCCVDRRGADPVVENDSAGEFLFLVAQLYRFTGDRPLLERMWPHVEAAIRYMDELRLSERTPKNLEPARRAFYGLMPPSISHEGYSDKPAYAYWDDFWALIGFQEGAFLAEVLGHDEARGRIGGARDEFRQDLLDSLRASATRHGVDYLPGSADRGDFDATSTTVALAPGQGQGALPHDLLTGTFERYYREFVARRDGQRSWKDYTPYELRVVGTFVRLGQRERAHELLDFFFRDQRPAGWNQWAEVVGRQPREPRFIGDMPHAWIASDYIRSALDLFAYTRPEEQQLVLAAGVPADWLDEGGVKVERLHTPYGLLTYSARRKGKSVSFEIAGKAPPGGFVIRWPFAGQPGRASVDGKAASWLEGELRIPKAPARVVFEGP
jgi:hypothetical protein